MAQDLRLLDAWVTEAAWPHVACPICKEGYLAVEEIQKIESQDSIRAREHEHWEPDWISGAFYGTLKCALPKCQEQVVISGKFRVREEDGPDGNWYGDYNEFLKLRFTEPPLVMITLPDGTPESVGPPLQSASAVLWSDPGAAANRLRFAIEELLTAEGMRRFVNQNGKRHRLTTHQRIQEFKKYATSAAEALEAVKWIGNTGSHDDDLTATDVLDGADLLRHALRLLYDKEDERVERRIREINRAKGLPKASKSRAQRK